MIRSCLVMAPYLLTVAGCSIRSEQANLLSKRNDSPLIRRYTAGEDIRYDMTATNATGPAPEKYSVSAFGTVSLGAEGIYQESFRWDEMTINNSPISLTPKSQSYRQLLSLDDHFEIPFPSGVEFQSELAGPVYDLMSFYADLRVAVKPGSLIKTGDTLYVANPKANSWVKTNPALLIAEDCIDFDLTLQKVDEEAGRAILLVRHVPPATSCVNLPAAWMNKPIGDKPNNWVQVTRQNGGFLVEVGREDFDDVIEVDTRTGRILQASMQNPVRSVSRVCTDEQLNHCGPLMNHLDGYRRIHVSATYSTP